MLRNLIIRTWPGSRVHHGLSAPTHHVTGSYRSPRGFLSAPRTRLKTRGDRAFQSTDLKLWNSSQKARGLWTLWALLKKAAKKPIWSDRHLGSMWYFDLWEHLACLRIMIYLKEVGVL